MTLKALAEEINEWSRSCGWWEGETNVGEKLALMHSELSEALEEWRDGHEVDEIYYSITTYGDGRVVQKPEGFPVELADVLIRVLDFCAQHKIDIDAAVKLKMWFNGTRPHRHGGKLA